MTVGMTVGISLGRSSVQTQLFSSTLSPPRKLEFFESSVEYAVLSRQTAPTKTTAPRTRVTIAISLLSCRVLTFSGVTLTGTLSSEIPIFWTRFDCQIFWVRKIEYNVKEIRYNG